MADNPFDQMKKQFTGQIDQMKRQFGGNDDDDKKKNSHDKKGDHDRRHHEQREQPSNNPFAQLGHQFQQQGRELQRQFTTVPNIHVQIGVPGVSGGNLFGGGHRHDERDLNGDGKVDKTEAAAFGAAHKLKPGHERDLIEQTVHHKHGGNLSNKEIEQAAKALQSHKVAEADLNGAKLPPTGGGRGIV